MLRDVPPDPDQDNVDDCPAEIVAGVAVNEVITGRDPDVTVTVAWAVTFPDEFVAVSV